MTAQTSPVSLFKFNAQDIRVFPAGDTPWFVARDVMEVLGFSGVTDMLRPLAKSERGNTPHPVRGVDGKNRYHTTISEAALYKLVMRSDKPQAKDFQNWVTQTVLPSIRKDGGYVLGEEKVVAGDGPSAPPHQNVTNHLTGWCLVDLREGAEGCRKWVIVQLNQRLTRLCGG